MRSDYRTVVAWPRRGDGERAAYNLARLRAAWLDGAPPAPAELQLRRRPACATASSPPACSSRSSPSTGSSAAAAPSAPERPARRRGALRSFADLRTGDIVVHEDHGIARFAGFDTKTVAGVTRDYLELEFAGTDQVFMPVDQLAKISRYVGAGGAHPPLTKLGGKAWETMKARARRAAQELAGELLNLYAERQPPPGPRLPRGLASGCASSRRASRGRRPPTSARRSSTSRPTWSAPQPMDRLICGDVGYGKTEVALRAAFKAADDGKQVLVLAPTTILAQQHFGTFSERLKDYPFTHRARQPLPLGQGAAGGRRRASTTGSVDILIGTHRLLGRDVRGKDLGLIVVDEEQRFGVKQKELLRQLKLQGRRHRDERDADPAHAADVAGRACATSRVIETPPEGRRPVKTYVGEYDEELVKQALMREKERGGQAFFVHNRVETIDETAERLRGLCPGVRFEVAHGQLDEKRARGSGC